MSLYSGSILTTQLFNAPVTKEMYICLSVP